MSLDFPNRAVWLARRATPNKLRPKPMIRFVDDVGDTYHRGSDAVYQQKKPSRTYFLPVTPKGVRPVQKLEFLVPEPWTRVTDKDPHPGRTRRNQLQG